MTNAVTSEPNVDASLPVVRHLILDRLYHWLMAIAVLVLLGTAFLPILGLKFQWLETHWITGIVLVVLVVAHVVRALFWHDWRNMMIWVEDGRDLLLRGGRHLLGGAA